MLAAACSGDATGACLVVWAVSEAGESALDTAIRRGWLRSSSGSPDLPRILHTAHGIASALDFLHANRLVYGELSGASVALCTGTGTGISTSCGGARQYAAKLRSSLHSACRAARAAANRGM